METSQIVEQEPTFQTVWAALQETDRIIKENAREAREWAREATERDRLADEQAKERAREADEQAKERAREADEQAKERDRQADEQAEKRRKEFDREMKELRRSQRETDQKLGFLSNRFGTVLEHMVIPNLVKQFKKLGFTFEVAHASTKIADHEHGIFTELDAHLENGDKVMIVEVKSKPASKDIDYHVERMEKLRQYADLKGDRRAYLGAVAGVVMSDELKREILQRGFYLVEPSGETFAITAPKGSPHIW